ncbi:MAG: ion transporter [Candidatus Woesearchaeota archaeon]
MEKEATSIWLIAYREFEHFTDHIIPVLVVLLAVALVLENPLWTLVHLSEYEPWIGIFDGVIVFFFVADLVFKWFKTRNIRRFFRLYWLDMVAVFPFYLAFRAYSEVAAFFRIGEEIAESGQKIAHEAVLLREAKTIQEAEELAKQARMLREAEELGKEARLAREAGLFNRTIRPLQRLLRMLKGRFYTSHRVLVEAHQQHKREHRATGQ